MNKIFKLFVSTVFVLCVLGVLALGFWIWGSLETGKRLDIGYGSATSSRLVTLEIGDRVFQTPQNYIWSRDSWKGGVSDGVNMHALLPDFDPYTEENKVEFDRPGWGRKISLLIGQTNNFDKDHKSESRLDMYQRRLAGREPNLEEFNHGLKIDYSVIPVTGDEYFVGELDNGDFYWVKCTPEGERPSPSCNTTMQYSDYIRLRYSFSREYLADWKSIDAGVLKLIRQFESNTVQGE